MKKIISVVGARPNFMKLAPIYMALEKYSNQIQHQIVHTGQHYDAKMSDDFFKDLNLPNPNYFMGVGSGSHSEQTSKIMIEFDKILDIEKPDLVLVVGDVNSTLACSISAVKKHYKVAHVEAGLRSWDKEMPEEINRMVTDAISDYFFVTEKSGYNNLINSAVKAESIFFVGNTMIDSLYYALDKSRDNKILEELMLQKGNYAVVTLHRPSNVDEKENLSMLLEVLNFCSEKIKVVFPIHPRTMKNIESLGLKNKINDEGNILFIEPQNYLNFLNLVKNSSFVLTDSGGIQEETTVMGVPCFTLRTTTERPSTIEIGTNILVQPNYNSIIKELNHFFSGNVKKGNIPDLWDGKAAERIAEIIFNKIFNLRISANV